MKADVISLDNKNVGSLDLEDGIFGLEVKVDILHRVVRWQLARRQAGTHKTKNMGEISGSTKKPFNQKGSGRARQGSTRAPQMRGGGKAFGPVVRSHGHDLPKKVRRLGLKTALSSKVKDGDLIILDKIETKNGKTSELVKKFQKLGWSSALIIDGLDLNEAVVRAARNVIGIDVLPQQGANVYDILRRDKLILTRAAVEKLVERLT